MAKKLFTGAPGSSEVGDIVTAWARRQGIDPSMISGYSIFRHVGEVPRIMLEMYFDDAPVKSEDVSRETCVNGHEGCNVCFRSPEPSIVTPEPSIVTVLRADHQVGMHADKLHPDCTECKLFQQPIPDWCPDAALCANCPGRISGDQAKCAHLHQKAKD